MQFMDDSLLPENQDPLVIQVAPYAPSFLPRDSDDIAVSMKDQVQKAVDCYNAGATVLHVHVREPDGKGSKRLEMFNEMLAERLERFDTPVWMVNTGWTGGPYGTGERMRIDHTRTMVRAALSSMEPAPCPKSYLTSSQKCRRWKFI